MDVLTGVIIGFFLWFVVRVVVGGIYTVNQNERAVKTSFGRAERLPGNKTTLDDPIATFLVDDERTRYIYPQVRVIPPGGPYIQMPWEKVYKISVATTTVNMALDFENPQANDGGTRLEAVTKDQLNTGLTGQIRYHVSENNLYAFLFAIKQPFVHVMGYFVSVLRQRIANFEAKPLPLSAEAAAAQVGPAVIPGGEMIGVSINDLRKNLRDLNEYMDVECKSTAARYGLVADAQLFTCMVPPPDVESALAAINPAHNMVSSDISLAQAAADQRIEQSKRAVEIETLKAQAEVQPLVALAGQLSELKRAGEGALRAYVRNVRLGLFGQAQHVVQETKR